jgi:hypothetical protein
MIERQTGFRATPVHELVNSMMVSALGIGAGQAVRNRSLGMPKIGKAQDGLRFLAIDAGAWLLLHSRRPPCHQTMIQRPLFGFVRVIRDTSNNPEVSTFAAVHERTGEYALIENWLSGGDLSMGVVNRNEFGLKRRCVGNGQRWSRRPIDFLNP